MITRILKPEKGFTLIEVLVALIIMVATISAIVAMLINARDSAQQQRVSAQQTAELRKAFGIMRRQVATADVPIVIAGCYGPGGMANSNKAYISSNCAVGGSNLSFAASAEFAFNRREFTPSGTSVFFTEHFIFTDSNVNSGSAKISLACNKVYEKNALNQQVLRSTTGYPVASGTALANFDWCGTAPTGTGTLKADPLITQTQSPEEETPSLELTTGGSRASYFEFMFNANARIDLASPENTNTNGGTAASPYWKSQVGFINVNVNRDQDFNAGLKYRGTTTTSGILLYNSRRTDFGRGSDCLEADAG